MESQFWEVLKTHPVLFIAAIIGAVFVVSKFLQEGKKLVGILGFKTPSEVTRHEHDLEEHERDERFEEIRGELRDIKAEMQSTFSEFRESLKTLKEDVDNVQQGVVMVLDDRITQKSIHYLDLGSIPPGEIKEYNSMFDVYLKNHGNHGVEKIFEKTMKALDIDISQIQEEQE